MDYDVVISGAGPAGSSAAYHLAKRGINVLLLDKCKFPREKTCGDGITVRAADHLHRMGLAEPMRAASNVVHGLRMHGPGKTVVEIAIPHLPGFPDHGYVIRRIDLDKMLVEHARETGAEVWEECEVTAPIVRSGRVRGVKAIRRGRLVEVDTGIVIVADGTHSVLGRAMGLLVHDAAHLSIAVQQYVEGVEGIGDSFELFLERDTNPGTGWIFPVTDSIANIGFGGILDPMRRSKNNISRSFEIFKNVQPWSSSKLRNARPISPVKGAMLRTGLGASKVECPGLILVGDAASAVNSLNGEGITFALETGEMAADHVTENCDTNGFGHNPDRDSFRAKLLDRYKTSFMIGDFTMRWANRPWVIGPLFMFVSRNQRLRDFLAKKLFLLEG